MKRELKENPTGGTGLDEAGVSRLIPMKRELKANCPTAGNQKAWFQD